MKPGTVYAIVIRTRPGRSSAFWPGTPPPVLVYIGATRNYLRRWSDHVDDLRARCHRNVALQAAFDTWGEQGMEFHVCVHWRDMSGAELARREVQWMEKVVREQGRWALLNTVLAGTPDAHDGPAGPPVFDNPADRLVEG